MNERLVNCVTPEISGVKVLIGVPTAEVARRADFYDYYNMLEKPANSIATFAHGQSPARNRNLIIRQALDHDCTHVLFLDDDIAFHPTMLMQLLAHNLDIVSGLYLMRNYPHQPIIFQSADSEGRCLHRWLEDGMEGLIEIVACGLGAVLIKTEVFRKMEEPWIRLGELEKDHWCDDIGFFRRVREVGFKIHCDLSVLVGHNAHVTLWPSRIEGKWKTVYNSYGTGQVTIDQPVPRPELVKS